MFRSAIVGLAVLSPVTVLAQTVMEEVTVTAQKIEQSLDDVPLAVSAISGDALRELGFQSSTEIAAQIPNVDVNDTGFTMLFSIRGTSLRDFGDANEAPVGFYVDDVYRGTLSGQMNQLFDIERVEVLRGPQGTLYGRNTTAGLVHYLSRRPTSEFEGYSQAQYGSHGQRIVEGAVSGPLGDRVRARLAAKYNADDGWQRNAAPGGGRFAVTDVWALRGQVEIDLTDSITALTAASYSSQDNVSPIYAYYGVLTSATSFEQCAIADIDASRCVNIAGFSDPDPHPERVFTELTPEDAQNDSDIFSVSERITWDLGAGTELVSISAYETVKKLSVVDEDGSASGAFGIGLQFRDSYGADTHQFSQEIRLAGQRGASSWLAGLYYFDDSKDVLSTIRDFEFPPGVPDTVARVGTQSWAAFADIQPELTDSLGLIFGVRYTAETKDVVATTGGITGARELDANATTGRVGLTWAPPDKDLLTYATVSTGFKSGQFNTTLLFGDIDAVAGADKETVTNFELGAKWGFWGGRARVRAAAFYARTDDLQGTVIDSGSGSPATRLINFGDATAYGGEIELFANPTSRLEIALALGLLDSEIDAKPGLSARAGWGTGANAGIGDLFPLDGNSATNSPKWTLNGVVRYGFDLFGSGKLTLQSDFDWQGEESGGVTDTGFAEQESYAVVNARAIWNSASDRYYGELFVENVFDEEYHLGGYILAGFDYKSTFWARPRWTGLRVGVNF